MGEADGFIEDIIHPNVKEEVTIDGEAPRKFPCAQCKDGFITPLGKKHMVKKSDKNNDGRQRKEVNQEKGTKP